MDAESAWEATEGVLERRRIAHDCIRDQSAIIAHDHATFDLIENDGGYSNSTRILSLWVGITTMAIARNLHLGGLLCLRYWSGHMLIGISVAIGQ